MVDENDRMLKTLTVEDKKQGNVFSLNYTLEKPTLISTEMISCRFLKIFEANSAIFPSATISCLLFHLPAN